MYAKQGTQYLHYWKPSTADRNLELGKPFDHDASDQLTKSRIHPGDIVWVATVRQGSLRLLGRIVVDVVIDDQREAERRHAGENLWEAKFHVFAIPGTECILRDVCIMSIAPRLRFESKTSPCLKVKDGGVSATQLQTIRKLTPPSASLLQTIWEANGPSVGHEI